MTRVLGRVSMSAVALAVVVLAAQVAEAQPGGGQGRGRGQRGFGGRGGANVVTIAANEQVQTMIAAKDEQKTKITEIRDKLQEDTQAAFTAAGDDFAAVIAENAKLTADAEGKVAAVLDATQNEKVLSILANVSGVQSLTNAQMQKNLKVTDEQKTKLTEVAAAAPRGGRRGMSEEEVAALDKQYTDVLSTEQQAAFAKLKTVQPVEDELAQQLRGRGGRGRGRRGGGN